MEVTYIPKACKEREGNDGAIIAPKFEGHVIVRAPTFEEKYDYMDQCGIEIGQDGTIDYSAAMKPKTIRKMVALSKPHYIEIALKRKSDGSEVTSLDELMVYPDCEGTLVEIGVKVVSGTILEMGNG